MHFLIPLEILILDSRLNQATTDMVHVQSWKISTHVTSFCNPVLFIITLDRKRFGLEKSMAFSHQNSQISEKVGVVISIFLGSSVLHWHIVKQLSIFVTGQSSTFDFLNECFRRFWLCIVLLSPIQLWHTMSSLLDIFRTDLLSLQKCPDDFFLLYRPRTYKTLSLSFCLFIQPCSIRSFARVTNFANLKS